jgi:hypothetical protein
LAAFCFAPLLPQKIFTSCPRTRFDDAALAGLCWGKSAIAALDISKASALTVAEDK